MSTVIINGKKFTLTDANAVIENNTNEDLHNHFYGKDSIDAKWTRHIADVNAQLKTITQYKAGRPKKQPAPEATAPELEA